MIKLVESNKFTHDKYLELYQYLHRFSAYKTISHYLAVLQQFEKNLDDVNSIAVNMLMRLFKDLYCVGFCFQVFCLLIENYFILALYSSYCT